VIFVEEWNVKDIDQNHHLAKYIHDASWGKFFELLNYKAEEAGRLVVRVPLLEPIINTCNACGTINQELTPTDSQWVCKSCGVLHNRAYNIAKNIRRVGQTL
jgi:putative transposase